MKSAKRFEVTDRQALIDPTGKYRWWLSRTLESREGVDLRGWAVFVMLNPSTADGCVDDPTIRRCMGFAYEWGCAHLSVVNLFAIRSANPMAIYTDKDPVGPENDEWIMSETGKGTKAIVAAWGAHGSFRQRAWRVRGLLHGAGRSVWHLGLTKDGYPRHPLYLKRTTALIPMPTQEVHAL